jgi:hypothetical protein
MSRQRLIVQMGMGVGATYNEAAARAVADAQGRAQIHVDTPMTTRLTLAMPQEMRVESSDLARAFGASDMELHIVRGGMLVPQPDGSSLIVISAAIELFPKDRTAEA